LINHVHYLLIGGLQAVEVGNAAVWSSCARGLIETLGVSWTPKTGQVDNREFRP
jgi:hypothetical protein